jgi:hypothetical protein
VQPQVIAGSALELGDGREGLGRGHCTPSGKVIVRLPGGTATARSRARSRSRRGRSRWR